MVVREPLRSAASRLRCLRGMLLLPVFACVSSPAPVETTAPLRLVRFEDPGAGVAFDVPADASIRAADGAETLLALGEPAISVSLFHEYFDSPPDIPACWKRLEDRVRGTVPPDRVPDGKRLADVLAEGLERGGGRVLRVTVAVRGDDCVVVAVEGPASEPVVGAVARSIAATLVLSAPAAEVAARLAYEAGMQFLGAEQHLTALRRLETASSLREGDPRVERAAGLAAFFASSKVQDPEARRALVGKSVYYLSKARESWRATDGVLVRPFERDDDFLRDVLMYLGLGHAGLGAYAEATAALGELVVRHPEDAVARYNFACVLALAGDGDEAMVHLREAVDRDPSLAEHARGDTDLVSLRSRADFRSLVPMPAP